jgi:hypothetical protein
MHKKCILLNMGNSGIHTMIAMHPHLTLRSFIGSNCGPINIRFRFWRFWCEERNSGNWLYFKQTVQMIFILNFWCYKIEGEISNLENKCMYYLHTWYGLREISPKLYQLWYLPNMQHTICYNSRETNKS